MVSARDLDVEVSKTMLLLLLFSGGLLSAVQGLTLDVNSADSIKSAASSIAKVAVGYYDGNQAGNTPGILSKPYSWWEGGALFDTLIDYWHFTGDSSYNDILSQGLIFQRGENNDYLPANQTKSIGNDEEDFWAFAVMSAAEYGLKDPPAGDPTWIDLAQTVFSGQVSRWDTSTCGGGLHWQIYVFNKGYTYKNAISTGAFFQLASRLARYTGNSTYATWAETAFDWTTHIGLIDAAWNVFDGTDSAQNCSTVNHIQFSYAAATYIAGAAHMYNATAGAAKWKSALDGLLNATMGTFFPNDVMVEVACESAGTCSVDMKAFKSFTARWLAATVQMAPYTSSLIMPKLRASAQAAAQHCGDGSSCTLAWTGGSSSAGGETGLGEALDALAIVQSLLIAGAALPATAATGGVTPGNVTVPSNSTGSSGAPGSGTSSSGAAGAASTSATSKPSDASVLTLDTAQLGMFSVMIAFAACILL